MPCIKCLGTERELGETEPSSPCSPATSSSRDTDTEGEREDISQQREHEESSTRHKCGASGIQVSQTTATNNLTESFHTLFGSLYTRWGSNACPQADGTELVYSGKVAGSLNGTNYMCMPDDADYFPNHTQGSLTMNAVEFSNHPSVENNCYATCAVCYTSTRSTVMMIPAKLQCPTNWTSEYKGYLMTDMSYHSQHVCANESLMCIETSYIHHNNNYELYFLYVDCSSRDSDGFNCPSYSSQQAITCVVCSR